MTMLEISTVTQTTVTPTITKMTENQELSTPPPCETCGKTNHSAGRCYVGDNAANRPLPQKIKPKQQNPQDSITGCVRDTAQHLN